MITAAIITGIIAVSALIWVLPQGNTSATNITDGDFSPEEIANRPADNLAFVTDSHRIMIAEVEQAYEKWVDDEVSSNDIRTDIDNIRLRTEQLGNRLEGSIPTQWQNSYSLYSQAFVKFDEYLQEIESQVNSNDKDQEPPALVAISDEMERLIQQSINSFPTT